MLIFAELSYETIHSRYERTSVFKRPLPAIFFLRSHTGHHRVANFAHASLSPEHGSAFHIQQIESLNMNVLPAYHNLFERSFLQDKSRRWGIFPTLRLHPDKPLFNETMLNLFGVKYVLLPQGFLEHRSFLESRGYRLVLESPLDLVLENPHVYPRMFAVGRLIEGDFTFGTNGSSPRQIAFTHDQGLLRQARRLGIATAQTKKADDAEVLPDSTAKISRYENARLEAEVNLKQPAVLVLTDNWHPNWHAYVNGKPAYMGVVDETFRGIALPAGRHSIAMRYAPATLPAALLISACVIAYLIGILLMRRRLDPVLKRLAPAPARQLRKGYIPLPVG